MSKYLYRDREIERDIAIQYIDISQNKKQIVHEYLKRS